MFEVYQEIKKMILKDPGGNFLSPIILILSSFLPGLLHLCVNERELFLLLDPIRILLYALTFSMPMFIVCFLAEIILSAKHFKEVVLSECCFTASFESLFSLCGLILVIHYKGNIRLDTIGLYLLLIVIGILIICPFRKKEGSNKSLKSKDSSIEAKTK